MAAAAPLPEPGDTVAGKYLIEQVIGQGGMSVVYGATHSVTGKRFAIKWLLPEDAPATGDTARRFIREAQVAGLFQHPNVVEVYDVGQVAGSFYMVMQWLEGESLASRLERVGSLSLEEMCECLIPCMHGVEEAHAAGIVHRDLKPANIFLCAASHHTPARPKVLDFGIAKISKHVFDVNSLVTKSGVLIGTPHYLSPEQLRSEPVDHRTDVYALGVIMYQLLSGRLPFPAENFGKLVLEIAMGTPPPLLELLPNLPPAAAAVVERAMAREPKDRYPDVHSLIEALEAACPDLPQTAAELRSSRPTRVSGEPQSVATPSNPRRRRAAYLALAVAVLGAGVLLAWLRVREPSAPPSAASEGSTKAATALSAATDPQPAPAPEPAPPTAVDPQPAAEPRAPEPAELAPAEAAQTVRTHGKRNPRGTPAAPTAAPAPAAPAAPPAETLDQNPLHMRLQ